MGVQEEIDKLDAVARRNTDVDDSAKALLSLLAQQLRDLAGTATDLATLKAAVIAKADAIDNSSTSLADAVSANTPAA